MQVLLEVGLGRRLVLGRGLMVLMRRMVGGFDVAWAWLFDGLVMRWLLMLAFG